MGTCGLSPANQEGGDTHPGEPKAHVPPAPGPQTSPTAASPPPARTLVRDGGLWGAGPLLHSPGGSGTGSEPSPAGSPVAPSSGFVFLRRAARPLHPGRKGKQEMPKEEGQSALERRPGPSRQFPLSRVPAPSGGRSGVGSFHPATFSTRRLGNFLPLKSQQGKAGRPREEGSSPGRLWPGQPAHGLRTDCRQGKA